MRVRASSGILAVALCLFVAGCGPAVPDPPKARESAGGSYQPIVGGAPTSAFPATGALTLGGYMHCTGTLIAPRKVVTAAHCLYGVSASEIAFALGPNLQSPLAVIPAASVTPHPSYDETQLTDDIGYVTLAHDASVAPMPILDAMDGSWVGRDLTFVGYGITSGYGGGDGVKRAVQMPIAQVWAAQIEYQTAGKNTCNGDSGGPAFAKIGNDYFVAGVTSYGDAGCKQYGVDTRVDVYASFLGATPDPNGGQSSDPCNGETYEGRCDGKRVIWCANGVVEHLDCKSCGFNAAKGYYDCL